MNLREDSLLGQEPGAAEQHAQALLGELGIAGGMTGYRERESVLEPVRRGRCKLGAVGGFAEDFRLRQRIAGVELPHEVEVDGEPLGAERVIAYADASRVIVGRVAARTTERAAPDEAEGQDDREQLKH